MESKASDKRQAQFLLPRPHFVAGVRFMRHARAALGGTRINSDCLFTEYLRHGRLTAVRQEG